MLGVYVEVGLSSEDSKKLREFVDKLPLPVGCRMKEVHYHITLAYSKNSFEYNGDNAIDECVVIPKQWDIFGDGDEKVLVLCVESAELQKRFDELVTQGYKCKFPTYRPHITVGMAPPDSVSVDKLPLPDFSIRVVNERVSDLDETYEYKPDTMCENKDPLSFLHFFTQIL